MTDELAKELAQVKQHIRTILISNQNQSCTLNVLNDTYTTQTGKSIPYRLFRYTSLEHFLSDLPDVVNVSYTRRGYANVTAVVNKTTQQAEKPVSQQNDNLHRSAGTNTRRKGRKTSAKSEIVNSSSPSTRQQNKSPNTRPLPMSRNQVKVVPFDEQLPIKYLMNSYTDGMKIETFKRAYRHKFGVEFIPETFGFSDLKECLVSLAFLKLTPEKDSYRVSLVEVPEPSTSPFSTSESNDCSEENSPISDSLRTNLKRVLSEFPEGLKLNKLLVEYERLIKHPLNCTDYGFNNALELVGELKDLFYMERPRRGGDWLLFDASNPPPPKEVKTEEIPIEPMPQRNVVPAQVGPKVKANIETVLLAHPDGIRVDQFQSVYMRNCNEELPWKDLGFDSIIHFFLSLPEDSGVQLYPCKSGTILVVYEPKAKTYNDSIPFDPVLPGMDYEYQTATVEMCGGEYIGVYVSQINNPGDLWFQLMDTAEELEDLMFQLEEMYSEDNAVQYTIPDSYLRVSMACALIYPECQSWHRGKVTAIISSSMVEVLFIDYGTTCQVERKTLRFLRKDFLRLPAQAIQARISNLKPVGDHWPMASRTLLLNLCSDKLLMAKVTSTTYNNMVSVLLADKTGENIIHLHALLLAANLAQYSTDSDSDVSAFLLGPQTSPVGPSNLADLFYQMYEVQRTAYFNQLAANQLGSMYMPPYPGINCPLNPMPEDRGNDTGVLQKAMAMGPVKPLEVNTKSSEFEIASSASSPYFVISPDAECSSELGHYMKPLEINTSSGIPVKPETVYNLSSPYSATETRTFLDTQLEHDMKPLKINTESSNFGILDVENNCGELEHHMKPSEVIVNGSSMNAHAQVKDDGIYSSSCPYPVVRHPTNMSLDTDTTCSPDSSISISPDSVEGFDINVLQKLAAMGLAKPLDVDTKVSSMNIPTTPDSIYCSDSGSCDSVAESLSSDIETKTEPLLGMPDIMTVSCEQLVQKQHQYSQIISLNDCDVHLINYQGKPYMTSGDISIFIWGIDVLKKWLNRKKMKDPSITVFKKEAEDLFKDLVKNDVKILPDGTSVHLFPLGSVKEIVSVFHKKSNNIVEQLIQIEKCFNSSDSYWTMELVDDSGNAEDEMNPEKKLHELIQKKLKILQKMIQIQKSDSVWIGELQKVEEQIKQLEGEVKDDVPKNDTKEPIKEHKTKEPIEEQKTKEPIVEQTIKVSIEEQKEQLINQFPALNQNLGLPIRPIQPVHPIVNQSNAYMALMPQSYQLPETSMMPSIIYPPDMYYTLPYQTQQNAYIPQNISRYPGPNVPYSMWPVNNLQ